MGKNCSKRNLNDIGNLKKNIFSAPYSCIDTSSQTNAVLRGTSLVSNSYSDKFVLVRHARFTSCVPDVESDHNGYGFY